MIQDIIEGLTQEKLSIDIRKMSLERDLENAKMLLIESVFGYGAILELEKRPISLEEDKNWTSESKRVIVEMYLSKAIHEITNKRKEYFTHESPL